jgi:hypothetical protein
MTGPGVSGEDQRDRAPSIPGNLPVPDPTVLTTQLVDRALAAYREVVEVRLDGMDEATHLLANELTLARQTNDARDLRSREDRDRAVNALREVLTGNIKNVSDVTLEKFNAVDTRFQERDTRTQQAADESRISLDAALAAAKEAVSEQNKANTEAIRKSELATQKQIDSLIALMTTANKSVEDKISDLKSRLDRGEGQSSGVAETHSENRLNTGQILVALSVIIGLAGLIVAILLRT